MKQAVLITLLFITSLIQAQDVKYARKVVNTLCSPKYHGRGYVKNGDGKAAKFIYNEFKKLEKAQVQYQPFAMQGVNTFPGKMEVKVGGDKLKPGVDYIVDPACPSVKGTYDVVLATYETFINEETYVEFLKKSSNSTFIVIDTMPATMNVEAKARIKSLKTNAQLTKAGFIDLSNKKLIWSVALDQSHYPEITIAENKFPRSTKKIKLNIQAEWIEAYATNNVLAYIPGTKYPDSIIVLSAHYDHLGRMGKKTYFPGANDNASGTAIMLDIARHYNQNPPEFSVLFIAFAAEEAGLIGSNHYVYSPVYPLNKMKFLINLDLLATGDKGLMAVNGLVYTEEYDALVKINTEKNYLPNIQSRGKAANSDHYWFSENGVHSFFFYLMGDFPSYHDPGDKAEIVPFTEYDDTFRLIRDFIDYLQKH